MKQHLFLLSILFAFMQANAEIRLPRIFSDHLVFQQNAPIKIWGWAAPGEKITVEIGTLKTATKSGKDGKWSVSLPATKASGPFELKVKGTNEIVFTDVMVGEVWLCSGQSNMQFELKGSKFADTEIPNSSNQKLRHFKIPNSMSADPADDFEGGEWLVSAPETAGDFSAVSYYFGKKLAAELGVKVGIINASWGGTFVEAWTSFETLHTLPGFESYHDLTPDELENWFNNTEKRYDDLYHKLGIANRDSIVEDSAQWKQPGFDDNRWETVQLPQRFDYKLLPRFDGTVWFRREITVPENIASSEITIHLGRVDDENMVFVNGTKLGANLQEYKVQHPVLKPGKNVIAIRVHDYWERGGFLEPEKFRLTAANWEQSLAGQWKMTIGKQTFMWIRTPSAHPNLLFNGMIHPLLPFQIKGAIWYQGENNVLFAEQYRTTFPAMITDWRKHFGQGDFAFYFAQLPNMNSINQNSQNGGSDWAELRESQATALKLPNTAMAVTLDLGDSTDIHPTNKTELANRLALLALKNSYYLPFVEVKSPQAEEFIFENKKVVIRFSGIGSGLVAKSTYGYLTGYEVAGADRKFHYAKAAIEGRKVTLSCGKVEKPVAVRYGWANNPSDANLYSTEGFPAAPFRSDDWPLLTGDSEYQNWIK